MKRIASIALLSLVTTRSVNAQRVPGGPQVDWDRERAEYTVDVLRAYNALISDWRAAWERGDLQRATNLYTNNALLFVPGSDAIQGRKAIEEYLRDNLPGIVEIRTGLSDFVASDRLAYAIGPLFYRRRDAKGAVSELTGTCVTILVHENGRWRIRSQIFRY